MKKNIINIFWGVIVFIVVFTVLSAIFLIISILICSMVAPNIGEAFGTILVISMIAAFIISIVITIKILKIGILPGTRCAATPVGNGRGTEVVDTNNMSFTCPKCHDQRMGSISEKMHIVLFWLIPIITRLTRIKCHVCRKSFRLKVRLEEAAHLDPKALSDSITGSFFGLHAGWGIAVLAVFAVLMVPGIILIISDRVSRPKSDMDYNNRGFAYAKKGEYDLAISDYNKAIDINPRLDAAYNNRGLAHYAKGEYDLAILDCNEAIEINPRLDAAYNNRGLAYAKKGEYDQAIFDYTKALEINPRSSKAYNTRGIAYLATRQYDHAISDFTQALEICPAFAEVYYNRARAYRDKGEYDKAWEDVRKAQILGYQFPPEFIKGLREASGRER